MSQRRSARQIELAQQFEFTFPGGWSFLFFFRVDSKYEVLQADSMFWPKMSNLRKFELKKGEEVDLKVAPGTFIAQGFFPQVRDVSEHLMRQIEQGRTIDDLNDMNITQVFTESLSKCSAAQQELRVQFEERIDSYISGKEKGALSNEEDDFINRMIQETGEKEMELINLQGNLGLDEFDEVKSKNGECSSNKPGRASNFNKGADTCNEKRVSGATLYA